MKTTPFIALLPLLSLLLGCGPDKSVKYYNLGLEAAKRDDYAEAIRLWGESLRYRPDDAETRYNLGLALFSVKRYREAEEQSREAVTLDPLDHQAHHLLGKSLEEQGMLPEAKLSYESSLNIKPDYVPAFIGLASIALKESQNKSAENYATQAVGLDPNNLEANMVLSEAYFRNGNLNAAYGQLLSARKFSPVNQDLLMLLGKVTYERHMYADALEALGAARTLGMSNDEIFLYLGLANLALGYTSEAEKDFRLSLFKNPENARAWKGLGETYMKDKKWREATESIGKAMHLAPDDSEAAMDDAVITLNEGDLSGAAQKLERVSSRPDAPQITNYYRGHAYLRMGKNAEAREAFQRFLALWQGSAAIADEAKAIVERLSP
jgi:tetratricopeptide (TPR) repeat protein